jgi:hypothetical protein
MNSKRSRKRPPNSRMDPTVTDRVGAPVAQGASHRTGLVLFTSGSSGQRVVTPAVGRLSTSRYPKGSKSCLEAVMC